MQLNVGGVFDPKYKHCVGYTEFKIKGKVIKPKQFRRRKNELYVNSDDINVEEIISFLDEHDVISSTRTSYVVGNMLASGFFNGPVAGPYFALAFKEVKHAVLFRLFFG